MVMMVMTVAVAVVVVVVVIMTHRDLLDRCTHDKVKIREKAAPLVSGAGVEVFLVPVYAREGAASAARGCATSPR